LHFDFGTKRSLDSSARSGNDINVRFGSQADISTATRHVRFTPNSDRESPLPPKADMCSALAYVCFGPIPDICVARNENLERKLNNSSYRCDAQTKGVSFACSSLVEKPGSNLSFAGPRSFLWPQCFPRLIQHSLQELDSFGRHRVHF
jgi:hypothetical protein